MSKIQNNIDETIRNRKGPISYERAFVTVAKRLLKEETYKMLLEEAKILVEDAEEKFQGKLKEN